MRQVLASIVCFAFVVCAGSVAAQSAGATLSSKDAIKTDAHDRPIGGVTIKLPTPGGAPIPAEPPPSVPPICDPTPPPKHEDHPPIEEPGDIPPPEDPPKYFGESVHDKFTFILDASGSMSGAKVATMRAETTSTISQLSPNDKFDCVAYGGQFPAADAYSVFLFKNLMPASTAHQQAAINWVNGAATNPGGGTPSYECLQKCCQVYPADLTKMFFLTDGYPNSGAAPILADFPGWFSKFTNCELVAICIGGGGAAFMQALATVAGGTYVAV